MKRYCCGKQYIPAGRPQEATIFIGKSTQEAKIFTGWPRQEDPIFTGWSNEKFITLTCCYMQEAKVCNY